jgi:hypothetical protein
VSCQVLPAHYRSKYCQAELVATISGQDRCLASLMHVMAKRRSSPTKPALPGEAVMLGTLPRRRSTPRIPTCRVAWLTVQSPHPHEHVSLVKDISARGVFFYSDFVPVIGDHLDFVIEYLRGEDRVRLHFKGAVVRVERSVPGSVPGIAVSFRSQS